MSKWPVIAGYLLGVFYLYLVAIVAWKVSIPKPQLPIPVHIQPSPYEDDDPYDQQGPYYIFPV